MKNKKDRRHSGRKDNKNYNRDEDFVDEVYWDDWNDWRDGFRMGTHQDGTQLNSTCECSYCKENNLRKIRDKQKRLEQRRRTQQAVNNAKQI